MRFTRRSGTMAVIVAATAALLAGGGVWATAASADSTFIGGLTHNNAVASTVPGNGDVNPYYPTVLAAEPASPPPWWCCAAAG